MAQQGSQHGSNNTQYNIFHNLVPLVTMTVPGLVLLVAGLALSVISFAGWISFLFRVFGSSGSIELPGPYLPSGYPLMACYFIGFGGGGIISLLGGSMVRPKNGKYLTALIRHAVSAVVVIGVTVYGIHAVAGGVAYRDLLPHFVSCPWETDVATARERDPSLVFRVQARLTLDEWTCKAVRTP